MGTTPTGGSHGNGHPTARIHIHAVWHGGGVAARDARTAAWHADNRISQHRVTGRVRADGSCASSGPCGDRLCRGTERLDRIPMGRRPKRSTLGICKRSGSPSGGGNRRYRWQQPGVGCQNGDIDDSNRVHGWSRPGANRARCQPRPPGRQCDRRAQHRKHPDDEATGDSA
jgi:hypothetical protein